MSLTITQVRNDLLSKLGFEDPTGASDLALQDAATAINAAMQWLQTAGQDYFTRETVTVTIRAGTALYLLTQTIQAVIGPIRLNGSTPLRALGSRGELDQFDRIFIGSTSYGSAAGTPIAYWVENLRSPSTGDANQINLYLAPTPNAVGSVSMDVVKDAPAYAVADLSTAAVLPVAQNYTESIFLPLARMFITRSSLFSRLDQLEALNADGAQAMARLGFAGGFPNAVQQQPPREVSA